MNLKEELMNILMKRANGYYVEETEITEEAKIHSETGKVKFFPLKKVTKKRFVQSETALLSLLAYVDPEKWNEKMLIEKEKLATSTATKMKEWIDALPDEKIEQIIKKIEEEENE